MTLLVSFLVVALVAGTALVRAYTELNEDFLQQWARAHALDVTAENRPMVRWYLRTARVMRTWGALAGFFVPMAAAAAFDSSDSMPPVWVFVGYLLGALYAEVSLARPLPPGRRAASLVPRPLVAYLPRRLLMTQRVLGIAIALGCLAVAVVPSGTRSPWAAVRWWTWLGVVAGPALAVGLEWLQGWVVRRPQPFADPALVAADDAIRAQSVHSVSGSGLAVELVWLSTLGWQLAASDVQFLRWTMWVPAVLGFIAAIGVCQYYGHRAWRVRRPLRSAVERAAPA